MLTFSSSSHHLAQSLASASIYLIASLELRLNPQASVQPFLAIALVSFVLCALLADIAAFSRKYQNPWLLMLLIPLMEPLISFLLSTVWMVMAIVQVGSLILGLSNTSYCLVAINVLSWFNSTVWLSQLVIAQFESLHREFAKR
ncbi:hypothetical protein DSO57_1038066 [Entomophthora muscae]|uniref:Uncharacterized protein n=1 Tax=Entomophthora muscae TaxID=34485 RepID=A0ACC2SBR1_9FUNG|nr:hypothetical protein DSO57_1038066 [Entomophthora muscae]